MKSAILIGKGPSAVFAQQLVQDKPGHSVAVINNAGDILDGDQHVDYGFFTHVEAYELMLKSQRKIGLYVSPENDPYIARCNRDHQRKTHIHAYYQHNTCAPCREALVGRILEGGITHFNTATAAHHWLAKEGYKTIYLIGIDGGTEYAPGLDPISEAAKVAIAQGAYDVAATVHRELCSILRNVYGTQTVWIRMEDVTQAEGGRILWREHPMLEENGP